MFGQLRCFVALLLFAALVGSTRRLKEAKTPISLAVLLRTGGQKSAERLASIQSTWARDLEDGALTLMEADDDCKLRFGDNHWTGLTCLEAKSHVRLMNRTNFQWLLVVDDDVYVFADRLLATLQNMDPSKAEVYGQPYCGDCGEGRRGFCGGGGYLLSHQNLLKMASSTEAPVPSEAGEAFVQQMVSPPNEGWCDVRFGCVAQEKGLKLVGVKGMYGNGIVDANDVTDVEEETKVVDLESKDPPLSFHKVRDDEHMQRLYQEYQKEKDATRATGKETAYTPNGESGSPKWSFLQRSAFA